MCYCNENKDGCDRRCDDIGVGSWQGKFADLRDWKLMFFSWKIFATPSKLWKFADLRERRWMFFSWKIHELPNYAFDLKDDPKLSWSGKCGVGMVYENIVYIFLPEDQLPVHSTCTRTGCAVTKLWEGRSFWKWWRIRTVRCALKKTCHRYYGSCFHSRNCCVKLDAMFSKNCSILTRQGKWFQVFLARVGFDANRVTRLPRSHGSMGRTGGARIVQEKPTFSHSSTSHTPHPSNWKHAYCILLVQL